MAKMFQDNLEFFLVNRRVKYGYMQVYALWDVEKNVKIYSQDKKS